MNKYDDSGYCVCPTCGGEGELYNQIISRLYGDRETCYTCHGTGQITLVEAKAERPGHVDSIDNEPDK